MITVSVSDEATGNQWLIPKNSLVGTKTRIAEKAVLGTDAVRDDFFQVILGFGHDIQSCPRDHLLESASVPFRPCILPRGISSGDGMKRSVGFEPFRKLPAHKLKSLIGNDFSGWAENSEPQSAVGSADAPSSLVLQNAGLMEKCSPVNDAEHGHLLGPIVVIDKEKVDPDRLIEIGGRRHR